MISLALCLLNNPLSTRASQIQTQTCKVNETYDNDEIIMRGTCNFHNLRISRKRIAGIRLSTIIM